MIDLGWLWDDRRDANVGLVLCVDSGPTPLRTRVLLHSVIIASASEYFRKCLTTDVGRTKESGRSVSYVEAVLGCECKYEVFEQVDETQASAAMAVLEMVYKQSLPKEKLNVVLLLSMLLMSDRWMIPDCVALCQTALAALVPSSLLLEDLQAVYNTPAPFQSLHLLAPVMLLAREALLLLFGNVVTVVASPLLTGQLVQLPYAAVLELLSSSELVTDCEDSVLMMLSWWLEGDMGQRCVGTELQTLQDAVRYSQLSMTYLVQVVPQLPRLFPGQNKLLDLMEYLYNRATGAFWGDDEAATYDLPMSWIQPLRPHPTGSSSKLNLQFRICFTELGMHLKAAKRMQVGGNIPFPLIVSQLHQGLRFSASLTFRTGHPIISTWVSLPMPNSRSECELRRGIQYNLNIDMPNVLLGGHWGTALMGATCNSSGSTHSFLCMASDAGWEMGDPLEMSSWRKFMVDGWFQLDINISNIR